MKPCESSVIVSDQTHKFIDLLTKNEEFRIRTNIFTEAEFKLFFKNILSAANLKFHQYFKNSNVQKYVYSESFVCHHSGVRGRVKKDLRCSAKLTVRIKKANYHSRKIDKLLTTYPCFISLDGIHSHNVQSIQSVSQLKTLSPAKKHLHELFQHGLGPKKALCDMRSTMNPKQIANRSLLPNMNTAYYEYTKHTANIYGDLGGDSMMQAITNLRLRFPETKIILQVPTSDRRFCLFLQTPIMRRALQLIKQASELIFIDSTSSMDQMNSSLTTFHTWSPAGAIPIGFAITETQTIEDYEQVLNMLKSTAINGFCGAPEPKSFMTDDSDAEKAALASVFPKSRRLLCQFHVLQALWRWLWDQSHQIQSCDRKPLMLLLRELVGSTTKEILFSKYRKIMSNSIALNYPSFISHIDNMMSDAEQWALCFRTMLRTRGHHTNNFSERAIGIIKSTVLERKKVFNVTALAEMLIDEYEKVINDRLLDVALMRAKARHNPKNLNPMIQKDQIERDENSSLFFVFSQSDNVQHLIDSNIPICTCGAGAAGRLCKHIIAVDHWYPNVITFPKAETKEELFQLLQLAIGKDASNYTEFFQLQAQSVEPKHVESYSISDEPNLMEPCSISNNMESTHNSGLSGHIIDELAFEETCKLLRNCYMKFLGEDTSAAFEQFQKNLSKLHSGSKGNFLSALYNFGKGWISSKKRVRSGSLIRVQPTAKSRRKATQSSGNAPLMKGKILKKALSKKREHNLIKI